MSHGHTTRLLQARQPVYSTASISTTTTQASVSKTESLRSTTTTFASPTSPDTTTSSSTSAESTMPELFPGASHTDARQDQDDGVFNYYFLFLAVFGLLTAILLWWIHRRRKQRKEQMRRSGHNALARDMDGWINTRRWFHGPSRYNHAAAFVRSEEGLNEHGEAPPPYQTKNDGITAHAPARTHDIVSGLAVPLQTLSRDAVHHGQPPEYRETIGGGESSTARPDSVHP